MHDVSWVVWSFSTWFLTGLIMWAVVFYCQIKKETTRILKTSIFTLRSVNIFSHPNSIPSRCIAFLHSFHAYSFQRGTLIFCKKRYYLKKTSCLSNVILKEVSFIMVWICYLRKYHIQLRFSLVCIVPVVCNSFHHLILCMEFPEANNNFRHDLGIAFL